MPRVERDGASIYYEVRGEGVPLLMFAPGGLNSSIPMWRYNPINPFEIDLAGFQLIAMDQRNAARSTGPLDARDPWGMYADDQIAVLDHLDIERALTIGSCIGPSFILTLAHRYPDRVRAGVLMQPIGVHGTVPDRRAFGPAAWRPWGENLITKGAAFTLDDVDAFGAALFGTDFVFSITRDQIRGITAPMLVLDGTDSIHPRWISAEIAELLPAADRVERWYQADARDGATARVVEFLRSHADV